MVLPCLVPTARAFFSPRPVPADPTACFVWGPPSVAFSSGLNCFIVRELVVGVHVHATHGKNITASLAE